MLIFNVIEASAAAISCMVVTFVAIGYILTPQRNLVQAKASILSASY